MKLALRLALLGLALAPVAALGDNSPQVVMATPGQKYCLLLFPF